MAARGFAMTLLFVHALTWAEEPVTQPKWTLAKSEDGIRIHTREHQGGLVEIRAQMFLTTSYQAFLVLLEDSSNIPNWVDNVSESRVLKQISPTENIVYTTFAAPWPAKNRDMVTYSKYQLANNAFRLDIADASQHYPQQPGYVRIRDVEARWTLEKLTNGLTHIDYTAYADPGGLLPDWLTNTLSVSAAFNTFSALKKQLPDYQQYQHSSLNE